MTQSSSAMFSATDRSAFAARGHHLQVDAQTSSEHHDRVLAAFRDVGRYRSRAAARATAEAAPPNPPMLEQHRAALGDAITQLQACVRGVHAHDLTSLQPMFATGQDPHPFVAHFLEVSREEGFAAPHELEALGRELRLVWSALPSVFEGLTTPEDWAPIFAALTPQGNDSSRWGFPSWPEPELPPPLRCFLGACRAAGATPSLYILVALAVFLTHGHAASDAVAG